MAWTPSEGLMRAQAVVADIDAAAAACGVLTPFPHPLYHRLTEVIAKAIDQALADGAEKPSTTEARWFMPLPYKGEDGDTAISRTPTAAPAAMPPATGNGHAPLELDPAGFLGATKAALPPLATFDEEAAREQIIAELTTETADCIAAIEAGVPKKKRGRPKGSKAAKKRKSAKAIKAELYPEAEAAPAEAPAEPAA